MSNAYRCIGEILMDMGRVTQDDIDAALEQQINGEKAKIGEIFVAGGFCSSADITGALAEQFGMKFVDLDSVEIASSIVAMVPQEQCRENHVMPIDMFDGILTVAISDPLDLQSLDNIRFVINCQVQPVLATRDEIDAAIDRYYSASASDEGKVSNSDAPRQNEIIAEKQSLPISRAQPATVRQAQSLSTIVAAQLQPKPKFLKSATELPKVKDLAQYLIDCINGHAVNQDFEFIAFYQWNSAKAQGFGLSDLDEAELIMAVEDEFIVEFGETLKEYNCIGALWRKMRELLPNVQKSPQREKVHSPQNPADRNQTADYIISRVKGAEPVASIDSNRVSHLIPEHDHDRVRAQLESELKILVGKFVLLDLTVSECIAYLKAAIAQKDKFSKPVSAVSWEHVTAHIIARVQCREGTGIVESHPVDRMVNAIDLDRIASKLEAEFKVPVSRNLLCNVSLAQLIGHFKTEYIRKCMDPIRATSADSEFGVSVVRDGSAAEGSQPKPVASSPFNKSGSTSNAQNNSTSWNKGTVVLEDYVVESVLGEGGFGIVYLVQSKTTNERFAVKRARVSDPDSRASFLSELQTWVGLPPHPNLAACRFFRTVGDEIVIFAEYVSGGSLASWIQSGKLYEGTITQSLERILDIAIQFAWGLHAAHEMGLVHQDVKPDNVLMSSEGIAKVSDFGLSGGHENTITTQSSTNSTDAFSVAGGTPAYLSPEQAQGLTQAQAGIPREQRIKLTRQTDVWSWGVSVLEMFAGERTWHAGQIADSALELLIESGPENSRVPKLPKDIAEVVSNALRQKPTQRWSSFASAAMQLRVAHAKHMNKVYPRPVPEFVSTGTKEHDAFERRFRDSSWPDPRQYLKDALKAAGKNPAEAVRMFPYMSRPPKAQAINDLAIFDAAKHLFEKLDKSGESLAILLYDKGLLHEFLVDVPGACACYDNSIQLRENLVNQQGCLNLSNDLAASYRRKAVALFKLGNFREALELLNKCIFILERLVEKEGRIELSHELAMAYRNKASVVSNQGEYHEAVELSDKCIPIYEKLVDENAGQEQINDLAAAYRIKAYNIRASGNTRHAIEFYDKGIKICESRPEWEASRETASGLYEEKARAVKELGDLSEALVLYGKCNNIRESLVSGEGRHELAELLVNSYMEEGKTAKEAKDLRRALELFEKKIRLCENLIFEKGIYEMAYALEYGYRFKATLLVYLSDPRGAIAVCDKSIAFAERLVYQKGTGKNADFLAVMYAMKAIIVDEQLGEPRLAIESYDKATDILERMVNNEGRRELTDFLATTYKNKASAFKNMGDFRGALELCDKCIQIRRRLVNEEGRHDLESDLASSLTFRTELLKMAG